MIHGGARQIWRDFNTDGNAGSGKFRPRKPQIRDWGAIVDNALGIPLTTGTATAYELTLADSMFAYTNGQLISFLAHERCETGPTLNVNGLGARALMVYGTTGELLVAPAGALRGGMAYFALYNASAGNFRLLNPSMHISLLNWPITLTGGDGIQAIGDLSTNRTIAVDGTVVRTSGAQTIGGGKTFTDAMTLSRTLATTGGSQADPAYSFASAQGAGMGYNADPALGLTFSVDGTRSLALTPDGRVRALGTVFSGDGGNLSNVPATGLAGTIPSARMSGAYGGITGTGQLNSGSISSGFGAINIGGSQFTGNGAGITNLNMGNAGSGQLAVARGGTGSGNAAGARNNLGLGSMATRDFGTGASQHRNNADMDTRYFNSSNQSTGTLPVGRMGTSAGHVDWVRDRIVAMATGSVGTIATFRCESAERPVAQGQTRAGASLTYGHGNGAGASGASPSGTWRCEGALGSADNGTTFKRINSETILRWRGPYRYSRDGQIVCEVEYEEHGWQPCSVAAWDEGRTDWVFEKILGDKRIKVRPFDETEPAAVVRQSEDVRAWRDELLKESDWTEFPSTLRKAPKVKEQWLAYRDKLRDVPEQKGFPWDVEWPEAPQ